MRPLRGMDSINKGMLTVNKGPHRPRRGTVTSLPVTDRAEGRAPAMGQLTIRVGRVDTLRFLTPWRRAVESEDLGRYLASERAGSKFVEGVRRNAPKPSGTCSITFSMRLRPWPRTRLW
jgi:hypothetical protein